MTKLSFLPSLQKTRHPAAGGNNTYRLTVSFNCNQAMTLLRVVKMHKNTKLTNFAFK